MTGMNDMNEMPAFSVLIGVLAFTQILRHSWCRLIMSADAWGEAIDIQKQT